MGAAGGQVGADGNAESGVRIVRLPEATSEAIDILLEYYEAINVVQRDTPEAIRTMVSEPGSGLWLASWNGAAVGCVLLRALPSRPFAGECKRLYVKPEARGHGIGDRLMDALEEFARANGVRCIYLDSHDGLQSALALYRRRGYGACERYNENPQATVFLRLCL
jgi:ribosomal protein S18 acetylase RimI-like enzyme